MGSVDAALKTVRVGGIAIDLQTFCACIDQIKTAKAALAAGGTQPLTPEELQHVNEKVRKNLANETPAKSQPIIWKIDPNQGRRSTKDLSLSILGRNFQSPNTVQLVQDNDTIEATEVFSNGTEIRCKIEIVTDQKQGSWDLIVVNGEGGQDKLDKAFQITA